MSKYKMETNGFTNYMEQSFLQDCIREKRIIRVQLCDYTVITGRLSEFDEDAVVLQTHNGKELIYKDAIICFRPLPSQALTLAEGRGEEMYYRYPTPRLRSTGNLKH